jgi:hypothetical protein
MGKREKINQGEDRCGGDEPKNVREPERVVGCLSCRVDSNFLPHDTTLLGFDGSVP